MISQLEIAAQKLQESEEPVGNDFADKLPVENLDPIQQEALDKLDGDKNPAIGLLRYFASLKDSPNLYIWRKSAGLWGYGNGSSLHSLDSTSLYSDFVGPRDHLTVVNMPDDIDPNLCSAVEKLFRIAKSEMQLFGTKLLESLNKTYNIPEYFQIISSIKSVSTLIQSQRPITPMEAESKARNEVMAKYGLITTDGFDKIIKENQDINREYFGTKTFIEETLVNDSKRSKESILSRLSEIKTKIKEHYTQLYLQSLAEILDYYGFKDGITFEAIQDGLISSKNYTSLYSGVALRNYLTDGLLKFNMKIPPSRADISSEPIQITISGNNGVEYYIGNERNDKVVDSRSLFRFLSEDFYNLYIKMHSKFYILSGDNFTRSFTLNIQLNMLAEYEKIYTQLSNTENLIRKFGKIPDIYKSSEMVIDGNKEFLADNPAEAIFLDVFEQEETSSIKWNSLKRGMELTKCLYIPNILEAKGIALPQLDRVIRWFYNTRNHAIDIGTSKIGGPSASYLERTILWGERGHMELNGRGYIRPSNIFENKANIIKDGRKRIKDEISENLYQLFSKPSKNEKADRDEVLNSKKDALKDPLFIITTSNIFKRSDILPIKYLAFPSEEIQSSGEYEKYELPNQITDSINIQSQKPGLITKDNNDKYVLQLYGIPYSKITEVIINDGTDKEYKLDEDFEIQYDKKYGYYKLVFSENSGVSFGERLNYSFKIDPQNNNENAPTKSNEISLDLLGRVKLKVIASELSEVGYLKIGKALNEVALKMGKVTSINIEDAIRKASIYSFSDIYSKETLKDTEEVLSEKYGFLPLPRNDGKVAMICLHAATLTSIVFSEVFPDSSFYASNLVGVYDIANGVKVVGGIAHSDTRGVIGNEYIVIDSTPSANLTFGISKLLTDLKEVTIEKVRRKQKQYIHIVGEQIKKSGILNKNKIALSKALSQEEIEEKRKTYSLEKLKSIPDIFMSGIKEYEGIRKNTSSVKVPPAITEVGILIRKISEEPNFLYTDKVLKSETKEKLLELVHKWNRLLDPSIDPLLIPQIEKEFGNSRAYPHFVIKVITDMQKVIDSI